MTYIAKHILGFLSMFYKQILKILKIYKITSFNFMVTHNIKKKHFYMWWDIKR